MIKSHFVFEKSYTVNHEKNANTDLAVLIMNGPIILTLNAFCPGHFSCVLQD